MANFVFFSKKGKRDNQEDFYGNFKDEFFVVADGLGGHAAGEVAAKLAVKTTVSAFAKTRDLKRGFEDANKIVFLESQKNPEFAGMGTTLVGVLLRSNEIEVANVGDSRCYIFEDGRLKQVTVDHRIDSLLTRAIGIEQKIKADIYRMSCKKGDLILLATDGLTDVVQDPIITKILASEANLKKKAEGLVETALQLGSTDNITIGLIKA